MKMSEVDFRDIKIPSEPEQVSILDWKLPDEDVEEFFKTKVGSKLWRLNNLYKIRNKKSTLTTLRLNSAQLLVLSVKHNRKVILKSRQRGISTLAVAYNLDSCIFKSGTQAGVQSYGQTESDKLVEKADLMWKWFPKDLLELLGVYQRFNNSKGMGFSNDSVLRIGNFRGDTLQSLHVSELAKIVKKFPEKTKELKTGAFEAVAVDNKITIETTAEEPWGLFYDIWTASWAKRNNLEDLTPLDFYPIFIPWIDDEDCWLDKNPNEPLTDSLSKYIQDVEEYWKIELKPQQIWWLQKKKQALGNDFDREYPYSPEVAFAQSILGSYYKDNYEYMLNNNRIGEFELPENAKVHIAMDIGMNDTNFIVFAFLLNGKVFIFDEYENNGKSLEHYLEVLGYKDFIYGGIYWPHDMKVTEYSTGMTRHETAIKMGFGGVIIPRYPFIDGVDAVRTMMNNAYIHPRCESVIGAIQNFSKEWDEKLKMFLNKPVHNKWSHPEAALRYLAFGLGYGLGEDNEDEEEEWNNESNTRLLSNSFAV